MTLAQVLSRFSRTQLTTSIGVLALLASGSIEQSAPKPAPGGIQFQHEKALTIEPVGAGAAEFNAQQARPAAMTAADFDVDGVRDLAVGYGLNKGGEIAIMRGNLDAIAPQSNESWMNAGFGRYANAFLPQANMIPVPVEPDLLIAADVNGDGYLDLVFAANNGNAIYILAGNGKGQFTLLQPVTVPGTITALAAYKPGDHSAADALVVGLKTSKGFAAELYRMQYGGFALNAGYAMPGAVTAIATANLDSDLTPDAALIAGGQLVMLHGAGALAGKAQLETLPVSDAVALTAGSFLFDRHAGLQLAVLTSDGTVHFLAHQGIDSRPFTTQEITAARRNAMRHENGQTLAQIAGDTGNAPWTEVETLGGVASAGRAGTAPMLLRARASGSGQDEVLAVNGAQQEIAVVRHPAISNSPLPAASGVVTRSPLSSGDVVAAIAQRVSPVGGEGIIVLKKGSLRPEITTPAQSNTMYVNTQTDSLDANDASRCTSGSSEACSLRDAITYANADASDNITGGTSDTIMIPAGTYNLSYLSGTTDANNNAVTHLEILGPMTLVGSTSGGGVTINAQSQDVVFTINPGAYGSYNPSGDSYVFDTTFENLTITGGQNFNNPANSSTGMPNNVSGAINWDADGTGNLTLTNCNVESNTNGWGDGGGIWFYNSAGVGSGTLTLSGGSVSSNSTSEAGGAIYQASAPAGFSATSVTFASNNAAPSVNTNDPGGASGADDAGGIYLSAVPVGSGIPSATISGGSFTGNSADGDGGGIYTTQGISITGGTNFSSNTATGSGGGIFHNADATTTVTAANIASNSATNTGGGITVGTETAANGNTFTIANSRIFGNTSTNGASGLSVGEPSSSGAGAVTATENWWGCNAGPTTAADGCDQAVLYDSTNGSMSATPNIVLTLGVSPNTVNLDSPLQLDAAVNTDSNSGTVPGGPGALEGLTINFTATVGAFSASPSATIDGTGNATASVSPTSSGSGSATATLDNQTVTQNFTVASGAPAITSASSATFTAGTAGSFTVTTTGTPTPTLSESGALPSGVTFIDNGNGTASIMGTATLAASYPITITAQNGTLPNATQSFTINVSPGAATHLVIPGGPEPFYTAFGFNIYAYDAENNLATSYNGTVAFTSSDPGFVNLGPVTLVNGVGSQSAVLKTAGVDTITATDVSNPSITGTGSFTVQPGAATRIGVVAPSSAYAGSPLSFTVTAYDLYGNVATSYGGTVVFTSTDPNAVLPGSSGITNGTGTFPATMETVGAQTITATDSANSFVATSGAISVTIPGFVVTSSTDDAGTASNCTIQATPGTGSDASCSLRDALLAAANQGSGSITFDSTKFASAKTIALTNGTLNIPSNASVNGPTTGSGATLTNLVTVAGGGAASNFPVFTTASNAIDAAINNLVITNGNDTAGNGGAIDNGYQAALTIQNSTISGNNSTVGTGGIFNDYGASLTIIGSTISGNSGTYGAIVNESGGAVSLSESTISGNTASANGGAILSGGTSLTVSNSTIAGNSGYDGGGIYISGGTLTLTSSIVAGNTASSSDPDVDGMATDGGNNLIGDGTGMSGISNGTDGDQVGTSASPLNPLLAALGNYGGPTQTMIPLPGSPAICVISPSSATGTDQRGLPRTTTYGATTCQDAGSAETNYALSFTTNPAVTEAAGVSFPAAVTLTESGNPFAGVAIPITLSGGGTLAGSPVNETTGANGVASYTLTVTNPTALPNLTLIATLPAPPSVTATSSDFALTEPVPTVTSIAPSSGAPLGGTAVTITGTNFNGTMAVHFGATQASSFTIVNPTTISATSPAGTGIVDVTVTNSFGTSATTAADQFTYFAVSVTANPISAVAESAFSGAVATFNENTGDLDPLADFAATIAWGDGTTSAGTITQPGGAGTPYTVSGTHTYAASSSYIFTVTVTPAVGNPAMGTGMASVAPAPATHFMVAAPASAYVAGAFNFTVTALDAFNNPTTGYTGTIHFTSTDSSALLPANSTLTNGSGTFSATLMTVGSQTITATDTVTSSITGTTANISVTVPSFVVTNTNDSGAGSLRAALASAAANGSGNITFDPTVFTASNTAAQNTITLTSATLNIPSNTTITGPTTGSGATLKNLVTVSGNNGLTDFIVNSGVTGAAIAHLIVTGANLSLNSGIVAGVAVTSGGTGYTNPAVTINDPTGTGATATATVSGGAISAIYVTNPGTGYTAPSVTVSDPTGTGATVTVSQGSGIFNAGTLTVSMSTISANAAIEGGGIFNNPGATLTLSTSTFTNNTAASGGGLFSAGTLMVTNSTFSGNSAACNSSSCVANGGGISSTNSFTLTGSTVSGNSATCSGAASGAGGGGIAVVGATVTLANSVVAGNSTSSTCAAVAGYADILGNYAPTSGGGNVVGTSSSGTSNVNPMLAPLGNYGGPTQTMIPLPGSPVICAISPSSATGTDQRGLPRTTTYDATVCQDAGAVQTNYSLTFSTDPPANVTPDTNFTAGVTLLESNNPFVVTATPLPTVTIPLTLNGTGTLTGGSTAINDATGIATYSGLQINLVGNDTLTADLTLNPNTTPTALSISATSSPFTVGQASTTTTASNATATYSATSQNVALSATVTSTAGIVDAGTVTFTVLHGITPVGTAVSGSVTNGAASVSYTLPGGTSGGTYTIQAAYSGTASFDASTDTSHTLAISAAGTTTAATNATATFSASAQSITLSATVTSPSGTVNSGTVTFTVLQGSTPVGTAATSATVSNGSASASYTLPAATAAGTFTIQAVYSGTASLTTSSDNTHTLVVSAAGTTTAATNATATFSASAQSVTLSATVTSPSGTVNSGTVTFTVLQGSTPVGTATTSATVSNGSASASYMLPAGTATGTYTIQAVYNGTASLTTSSDNTHTLVIGKATATVTLGNLTQTYTGSPISAMAITAPTGLTVTLTYNGNANPPTAAGSYTVIGSISNANYQGSATGTLKINQATPSITWPTPAAINFGTALSGTQLDATASFNNAPATGMFVYTPPASTVLTAGTHTLSVTFTPADTNDFTTATQTVQIVVNQATPAITWSTPAAINYGTALGAAQLDATATYNSAMVAGTFVYTPPAGTVLSAGSHTLSVSFTPSDTVDFNTPAAATTTIMVNQVALDVTANNATKVYGTANPVFTGSVTGAKNNDNFTESFTTTATTSSSPGSYSIVPSVTGVDLSDYTQVVTDGTLTIMQAASNISLSASATTITPGEPLTLNATVTSSTTGTPTGTVTFYDGTIPLGTVQLNAGAASYTTSALAPGVSHSISATYSGDTNFTGSSTTLSLTVTVAPLEFTLTINGAASESIYPGGTVTYTFNVAPQYGSYAGTMNFAISGLPSGITATFSPDSIPANGGSQSVTLTISDAALSSAASPPTGLPARLVPIALGLLLLPLAGAGRMRKHGRRMRNIFYVLVLACSALSATILSGCGSGNGFFAQAPQNYNLTITATAGSVQKSATVTLNVQ